jgi:hypothetical protein
MAINKKGAVREVKGGRGKGFDKESNATWTRK